MSRKGICLIAAAFALAVSTTAEAASITFANETFSTGSGLGNVPTVLVIQSSPTETGAVAWTGTADSLTGDAKSQSRTWSVSNLADIGIVSTDSAFGLVLNLNETNPASDVFLEAMQVNFFTAAGSLLFSAPYTCVSCAYPLPVMLSEAGQGTGSSGFLFRVVLTPAERAQFFAAAGNRLGVSAALSATDSGMETVYLADLERGTTQPLDVPIANPEPASLVLFGTGIAALVARRIRTRRG
ncbi:MAG: PEP-CTERM sorting domain-containing protein [Vicinamibacterales bacterium]